MPEQPEVERAAQRLRHAARGRLITSVSVRHPAQRRHLPDAVAGQLVGRRIEAVERRGKHQLLRLDDGAVLDVHFRMAGDWVMGPSSAPSPRHERVRWELDDGSSFSLVDPRALATVVRLPAGADLPSVGPEVADLQLTPTWLRQQLASRRGAIKPILLDQQLLAGVGSIYASEALWHARIHPAVPARSLGPTRLARLIEGLRTALLLGETTATRYTADPRTSGLSVYGRAGEPCSRCGRPIRRIVQAARSTYFCSHCQRR